jgi:hypothetical protein
MAINSPDTRIATRASRRRFALASGW